MLVALALTARAAAAQYGGTPEDICRPGRGSNEARTMASFAFPLAFSAAAAPARTPAGTQRAGLELSDLPKRGATIRSERRALLGADGCCHRAGYW